MNERKISYILYSIASFNACKYNVSKALAGIHGLAVQNSTEFIQALN